jgi:hypothetical protein
VLGEWRYSSTHYLTSAIDGGEWSASRPGRFTPKERAPGTHWIGGWVGPRAVLDVVVKRKIPSPHRESNHRTPIVQPVAQRNTDWAITALVPPPPMYSLFYTHDAILKYTKKLVRKCQVNQGTKLLDVGLTLSLLLSYLFPIFYGVKTQKTSIYTFIAMKTSNLAYPPHLNFFKLYHCRAKLKFKKKYGSPSYIVRGRIQKFSDWPPGARTANGIALCH